MNLFQGLGCQFGYTAGANQGSERIIHAQNRRQWGAVRYNASLYHKFRDKARFCVITRKTLPVSAPFFAVIRARLQALGCQFGYIPAACFSVAGGHAL